MTDRPEKRINGKRVVMLGALVVLLLSAFVMIRIVQTSEPMPDPSTIPERPGR